MKIIFNPLISLDKTVYYALYGASILESIGRTSRRRQTLISNKRFLRKLRNVLIFISLYIVIILKSINV